MRAIVFVLFMLMLSSFAYAEDERFSVNVKVDVTDADASLAREKAMNDANREAIVAVAKRISTSDGVKKIAEMTDPQLVNFIKETSVVEEHTSNVRYLADLKIVVNEELLEQYMQERDIPLLAQKDRKKIVVIPLFREFQNDVPMLWEDENLWRKAWNEAVVDSSTDFEPIGTEVAATVALRVDQAKQADRDVLEKIRDLSRANDVYVLDAMYDGVEGLVIEATSLLGNHVTVKVAGAKSSGDVLFKTAIEDTVRALSDFVSMAPEQPTEKENAITVFYSFSDLSEWISAEQDLKNIKMISLMQVQAMMQGQSQLQILYSGNLEDLKEALEAKGYILSDDDGRYVLSKSYEE